MSKPSGPFQKILMTYEGDFDPQRTNWNIKLSFLASIGSQMATFSMYIFIFRFVKRHNDEMLKQSVITKDTFNARKSGNIFTLSGQILATVIELSFYVPTVIIVTFVEANSNEAMASVTFLKMMQTGILSTLQVLSSADLRGELRSWAKNFFWSRDRWPGRISRVFKGASWEGK